MRFISAWSETGLALAAAHGLTRTDLEQTYLVVRDGVGLTRSEAGLALLAHLRAPWRWLRCLAVLPRNWRDFAYDVVARNRYRWFGSRQHCFIPSEKHRHRFIDR